MMENSVLESLISVITKSSDKNAIFKALVRLRAELVKDKNGILTFYGASGIAPVIRLLSKPYEKILEVALSILGNCCTQQVCCKQAISHGIVAPLITILKSIPNPKVQCRVCRLLGNLARQSNPTISTMAKGVGIVMASILSDTKDAATLSMAVRATRLFWNDASFQKDFIGADGVVKMLKILIDYTLVDPRKPAAKSIVEESTEERNRVDFMEMHIRAMEAVNSHVFDCEILKRVKPVVDDTFRIPSQADEYSLTGEILKCLEGVTNVPSIPIFFNFSGNPHCGSCITFFARNDSNHRMSALKILSNLAKLSDKRILNDADTMTTACDLIMAPNIEKPLTDTEERYCINIICCLADDACNRAKVRKSGAFKHLLHVAKNTASDSLLTMILVGLQHFRYDNLSTDLMIKMGLMNVLIDRLQTNIDKLEEEHNIDITSPSTRNTSTSNGRCRERNEDIEEIICETETKRFKIEVRPRQSPSRRESDSPPPFQSTSFFQSPCASPSSSCSYSALSPSNQTFDDIDDYSPVVSDIEDQNDDDSESRVKSKRSTKEDIADNTDIMERILNEQSTSKCELEEGHNSDSDEDSDIAEPDADKEADRSKADNTEQKQTIRMVLSILCSASYRLKFGETVIDLCTPHILNTLMQACRMVYKRGSATSWDSHGAPMVLSSIIENRNFAALLKYDFIFQVYNMANPARDHKHCTLCQDLKFVAEGLLSQLSSIGESGHGQGEMAHHLLRSDKAMNQRVSVITAIIIRDPKLLHTLLIKLGALYTITNLIVTNGESLTKEAAVGLHALAKTLKITEPDFDVKTISGDTVNVDEDHVEPNVDVVTFIGGDRPNGKNIVRFNATILAEMSEVFGRMLASDFRESQSKTIELKDRSVEGIRYFLDCLEQMSKRKSLRIPLLDDRQHTSAMEAALQAYDMCQMYLMPELEKDILNMITYIVDASSLAEVFHFSMKMHKHELTELAVFYYLTSDSFTVDERLQVFRSIDVGEYCKEWNDFVLDTIAYTCQNHQI